MMVMPSNNAKMVVGYWAGKYPGKVGWLLSADGWKEPKAWLPYAIDNGAYPAWENNRPWNEDAFYQIAERARLERFKPLWIVVPDVVTDRNATLQSWFRHAPRCADLGHTLAMAVQNGMTPDDVPDNASVVFVGGTTEWKWRNLKTWTANFPRVHVGRVNTYRHLWQAHEAGAESCDGTGWFRGCKKQLEGLGRYLSESTGETIKQQSEMAI